MPLNNQKPTPICIYFYLLIFFHPFNPYNPCSFHLRVFFRTRIYRIDTDASLCERVSPLDKIRYILIIRVRFTTEFFFEHGFIGLTRMLRSVGGTVFQPNSPSMPLNNQKPTPIFLYFYLLIFFHPLYPQSEFVSPLSFFFEHGFIGLTQMLRSVRGTVFQTKLGNG